MLTSALFTALQCVLRNRVCLVLLADCSEHPREVVQRRDDCSVIAAASRLVEALAQTGVH